MPTMIATRHKLPLAGANRAEIPANFAIQVGTALADSHPDRHATR